MKRNSCGENIVLAKLIMSVLSAALPNKYLNMDDLKIQPERAPTALFTDVCNDALAAALAYSFVDEGRKEMVWVGVREKHLRLAEAAWR